MPIEIAYVKTVCMNSSGTHTVPFKKSLYSAGSNCSSCRFWMQKSGRKEALVPSLKRFHSPHEHRDIYIIIPRDEIPSASQHIADSYFAWYEIPSSVRNWSAHHQKAQKESESFLAHQRFSYVLYPSDSRKSHSSSSDIHSYNTRHRS